MSYIRIIFYCLKTMTYNIYFSIRNSISHIKKKYCSATIQYFALRKIICGREKLARLPCGDDILTPVLGAKSLTARVRWAPSWGPPASRWSATSNPIGYKFMDSRIMTSVAIAVRREVLLWKKTTSRVKKAFSPLEMRFFPDSIRGAEGSADSSSDN